MLLLYAHVQALLLHASADVQVRVMQPSLCVVHRLTTAPPTVSHCLVALLAYVCGV